MFSSFTVCCLKKREALIYPTTGKSLENCWVYFYSIDGKMILFMFLFCYSCNKGGFYTKQAMFCFEILLSGGCTVITPLLLDGCKCQLLTTIIRMTLGHPQDKNNLGLRNRTISQCPYLYSDIKDKRRRLTELCFTLKTGSTLTTAMFFF